MNEPIPTKTSRITRSAALPADPIPGTTLDVTCVHLDVCHVPIVKVTLGDMTGVARHGGEWPVMVGNVLDLPVPFLISQDLPGFPEVRLKQRQPKTTPCQAPGFDCRGR